MQTAKSGFFGRRKKAEKCMYIHENQSRDDQIVDARSGQCVEKKLRRLRPGFVCRCLNAAAAENEGGRENGTRGDKSISR